MAGSLKPKAPQGPPCSAPVVQSPALGPTAVGLARTGGALGWKRCSGQMWFPQARVSQHGETRLVSDRTQGDGLN